MRLLAAIRAPHGRTIVEAVGFKPLLIWWFGEEISQPLLERIRRGLDDPEGRPVH
jgi:hypothetical protein